MTDDERITLAMAAHLPAYQQLAWEAQCLECTTRRGCVVPDKSRRHCGGGDLACPEAHEILLAAYRAGEAVQDEIFLEQMAAARRASVEGAKRLRQG